MKTVLGQDRGFKWRGCAGTNCCTASGGKIHHCKTVELFCRPNAFGRTDHRVGGGIPQIRKQLQTTARDHFSKRGILCGDHHPQPGEKSGAMAGRQRAGLQRELPPPFVCFGLTRNLGQDLFQPPNVKGWDGGLSWITTNNLLARYNEAAVLVQGIFRWSGA